MSNEARTVVINRSQLIFLKEMGIFPEDLLAVLDSAELQRGRKMHLEMSPATADRFREHLTEHFVAVGLRADDEPNAKGLEIEDLIDEFYMG
jgi:hypothetical protein